MKYVVIGPGSIGSLITYALNESGITPYIVFRTVDKARIALKKGLRLHIHSQEIYLKGYFTSYEDIPENFIDIAFICTKSYDVPSAISLLKGKLRKNSILISVQNGLGALETIRAMLPQARVLALVLNCGVFRENDFEFVYSGCGESYIGSSSSLKELELLANILSKLRVRPVKNVESYRWLKLAINAAINPLTAIRGVRNGAILKDKYLLSLALKVVGEVEAIAKALKIRMPSNPVEELIKVARATENNYSSMLQDVMAGRRTEIDFINGAVSGRASVLGIKANLNEALWLLIKSIESNCVRPSKRYEQIN